MKTDGLDKNDITIETENKSVKEECVNTGNKKKKNCVGMRFGTLTVTNQYNGVSPCGSKIVKVDYICDCGFTGINRRIGSVQRQKMCLKCKKKNKFKILPNGETAFNCLYSSYEKRANKKSLDFKLTKEQFRELTKQNCVYCDSEPSTVIKPTSGGGYTYNGIDRVNSNIGYISENCVPCCKVCNYFKMSMPVEDFLNHVKKIYEHKFVENKK